MNNLNDGYSSEDNANDTSTQQVTSEAQAH